MFDCVLNTPLFLDSYYLRGLNSFLVAFYLSNSIVFFDPKYFYEMAICYISYYKLQQRGAL